MNASRVKIRIPDLGDVTDVRIVGWLAETGDRVDVDQDLLEVETEKTTFVIPAPCAGRLVRGGLADGAAVSRGDTVGEIETGG